MSTPRTGATGTQPAEVAPTGEPPRPRGRVRRRAWTGAAAALVVVLVVVLVVALVVQDDDPPGRSADGTGDTDTGGGGAGGVLPQEGVALLDLPRIPWEGGPEYWSRFPAAVAAGWTDPSFFPVVAWYDGISSDEEVQYDRGVGINTYIGMDAATPYSLFADNGVFWMGSRLNESFPEDGANWPASFLDDEVDGRFTPEDGRAHLEQLREDLPPDRPAYANFTQTVVSTDMSDADAEAYVNDYSDIVSVDMYWYTIPFCDLRPFRGSVYLQPIREDTCRTASSYGAVVEMLRERDAADGRLQAVWQFVELLNGGPGEGPFTAEIEPGQLQGAVMSSLINEARGIVWFNQSLSGPCQGGNLIRLSQVQQDFCGAEQVAAAAEVNGVVRDLAAVLNTQSYEWDAGPGLDTMLKAHDGSAYLFAMVDGSQDPGERTLRLPPGVEGTTAEVLFEDRSLPIDDGVVVDTFAEEHTWHVYRVALAEDQP
ncbi:hypothetical protein SAMN05444351_0654 [Geodermatophilus nigrescens]|uniref:Uncharacterized protein n=1 Tax=Geodermatophilus nigrescens TaxID=1070870 RepID=A0A1M5E4V9_9ACTN|nr:hypothetical protein SAMN05444351_0654 [Geodermatophilus nigrescens]